MTAFIDWDHHVITYSSAGHPPPVPLRAEGTTTLLDQATDPRLDAARPPARARRPSPPSPTETSSCSAPTV
ncbi:SpoIIE family protein phosphatase [Streptomyces sp. NPDC096012]|uniref:SpoIIE family protein phosphatase n=1 Tax=Streptomyces sp. NPDC096012 TaxID=3155684 RepID=UPI00336A815D